MRTINIERGMAQIKHRNREGIRMRKEKQAQKERRYLDTNSSKNRGKETSNNRVSVKGKKITSQRD